MACLQDPDLMKHGITVDDFTHDVPVYMLTHAHSDHMKGLTKNFKKNKKGKIWCTQVTAALAIIAVSGLELNDFHIIQYEKPFHPVEGVTAWAFPAYHCDGSCMFLFELNAEVEAKSPLLRILYTGDFRFHPDMRDNSLIMENTIDRLYYDDMFDEIDTPYPDYAQSTIMMADTLVELQDQGEHKKIYINASILGIEPLLRQIADMLGIKFGLSPNLRNTWRGQQLKYLLEQRLDTERDHIVTLGHRNKDRDNDGIWIIPGCTFFICNKKEQKSSPNTRHIWFCTHSNQIENNRFKALVGAHYVNSCDSQVGELKCNKTNK